MVTDAFATLIRQHGAWLLQSVWCPATTTPAPSLAALRDQTLRLLPHVAIGAAWSTSTLINVETVLWADTGTARNLASVTVLGQPVALRIRFAHAYWSFGDGDTDTATTPGPAYTATDPCSTVQCPHYYGHTYTSTGAPTITLTVAWHAQFSLDHARTWTDVEPAPLTGPQATHQLRVLQARGVLVPNPAEH